MSGNPRPAACGRRPDSPLLPGPSLPQYRDHDRPVPRPDVAFDVEDLLPHPEDGPAVRDRHRQRRPEERRLQVRVTVAVVPGLFVAVMAAGWDQLTKTYHGGTETRREPEKKIARIAKNAKESQWKTVDHPRKSSVIRRLPR